MAAARQRRRRAGTPISTVPRLRRGRRRAVAEGAGEDGRREGRGDHQEEAEDAHGLAQEDGVGGQLLLQRGGHFGGQGAGGAEGATEAPGGGDVGGSDGKDDDNVIDADYTVKN